MASASSDASESPLLSANETCATLADPPLGFPSNCRAWRSCRSCLQKSGCAISASSRCVSQSDASFISSNATTDYRNALALNVSRSNATVSNATSQSWQFPAIETTYCAVDDAVCTQCKEASFYRPGAVADSRFCVGSGGCVCVFNCEVVDAAATQAECLAPPPPPPSSAPALTEAPSLLDGFPETHGSVIFILVIPIGVLLVASVWCSIRKKYREQNQPSVPRSPAQRPSRSRPSDVEEATLGLSGWNNHRDKLIDNEHRGPAVVVQLRSPTTPTGVKPTASSPSSSQPMRGFL